MKIYVASSWRNNKQQKVVELLKFAGHEVYDFKNPGEGKKGFAWSEIDAHWQSWNNEQYIHALDHPIAQGGFRNDFNAMHWADVCVMVMPCGRSAHVEAGWMQGAGKPTIVYLDDTAVEPELMYKMFHDVCSTMDDVIRSLDLLNPNPYPEQRISLQVRVGRWLSECFGDTIATSEIERCYRFFEEAAELVQSLGMSKSEAFDLIEYVFDREKGEPHQEVGGVMITLAALCYAARLNMTQNAEMEYNRITRPEIIEKIRRKHNDKVIRIPESALPGQQNN